MNHIYNEPYILLYIRYHICYHYMLPLYATIICYHYMSAGQKPRSPLKGPFVGLLLSVFGIFFDIFLMKTGTL